MSKFGWWVVGSTNCFCFFSVRLPLHQRVPCLSWEKLGVIGKVACIQAYTPSGKEKKKNSSAFQWLAY